MIFPTVKQTQLQIAEKYLQVVTMEVYFFF